MEKESPETTGVYKCPSCGNTAKFIGIDANGYGGPDACENDHLGACREWCNCTTELAQAFDVLAQDGTPEGAEFEYHSFDGGEHDSEIGSYTKIICRVCAATVWKEQPEPRTLATDLAEDR